MESTTIAVLIVIVLVLICFLPETRAHFARLLPWVAILGGALVLGALMTTQSSWYKGGFEFDDDDVAFDDDDVAFNYDDDFSDDEFDDDDTDDDTYDGEPIIGGGSRGLGDYIVSCARNKLA
jgi:hypothetical protein